MTAVAQMAPSPVVELNRAVAVGMAFGPAAGLELVDALVAEQSLKSYTCCRLSARPPEEARPIRGGAHRVRAQRVADRELEGTESPAETSRGMCRRRMMAWRTTCSSGALCVVMLHDGRGGDCLRTLGWAALLELTLLDVLVHPLLFVR